MIPNKTDCRFRMIHGRRLMILAWMAVFAACAAPAFAGVLVDNFSDFSQITWRTDNWKFSVDNPARVGGFFSRLSRTDAKAASIVYHMEGIAGYDLILARWRSGAAVPEEIDVSPDGKNWVTTVQKVVDIVEDEVTGRAGMEVQHITPQDGISAGMNYIRVTIGPGVPASDANGPFVWDPQLCKMSIEYTGHVFEVQASAAPTPAATSGTPQAAPTIPELSVPGGLTVLAASDTAAIQWLPIPSASSYAVNRCDEGDSFKPVATGVSSNYYVDKGLKPNQNYSYRLVGLKGDGSPIATETVSVKPLKGAVMMTDSFDDWQQADSHTDNVDLAKFIGIANCAKRTSTDFGSVVYNLPGAVRFAFTTYLSGDIDGQVSVDSSTDGQNWTPVRLAYTQPVPFGDATHFASVWAPYNDLPGGTNYLRINLLGESGAKASADTPALACVRVAYGATTPAAPTSTANSSTEDTFEDPLTDWSKTAEHSDCLALDGVCDHEKCIQRHGGSPGDVVYHVPKAVNFSFDLYYNSTENKYLVESSTDAKVWAPVDVEMSPPTPSAGDRESHVTVNPKQPLPDGTAYIRITFLGVWGVEIGGIKIYTGSTSSEVSAVSQGSPSEGGLPTGATAVKLTGGSPPGAASN
ncbi:MAG: hypothetical protein ACLQVD_13380 [Capsulimonadaceae bacterium]